MANLQLKKYQSSLVNTSKDGFKDESTYQLNKVNFEDSQAEMWVPYCSPMVLARQAWNKTIDDVELARQNETLVQGSFMENSRVDDNDVERSTAAFCIPIFNINENEMKNSVGLDETLGQQMNSKDQSTIHFASVEQSFSVEVNPKKRLLDYLDATTQMRPMEKENMEDYEDFEKRLNGPNASVVIEKSTSIVEITKIYSRAEFSGRSSENLERNRLEKSSLEKSQNKSKKHPEDKENNENVAAKSAVAKSAEIGIQTSFVLDDSNQPKTTNKRLSMLNFDSVHKRKLKQMLEVQRHEKKSRELELLAKYERLEAERLRKQMLEYEINSSSLLKDLEPSLNLTQFLAPKLDALKKKRSKNQIELDANDDLTIVSSVKNKSDLSLDSNDTVISNDLQSTLNYQVEALSINESAFNVPSGVVVIKENQLSQRERRKYGSQILSNIMEENSGRKIVKPKNKSFFSNSSFLEISKPVTASENKPTVAFKSMSLQEAFGTYKRDLIERSKRRQIMIEERSKLRKERAEYERSCAMEANLKFKEDKIAMALKARNSMNVNIGQKRHFSVNEIKEITRKNYEKLPEVKQKQHKQNLEKSKQLNRIRSNVYKKAIQHHLLTKGPNFHLNYKALNN